MLCFIGLHVSAPTLVWGSFGLKSLPILTLALSSSNNLAITSGADYEIFVTTSVSV